MTWADLFERAEAYETDVGTIRERLAERRDSKNADEDNAAEEAGDA